MQPNAPAPVSAPAFFTCADCGAGPLPCFLPGSIGSNYAGRHGSDAKVCIECAHRAELESMRTTPPGGRFCGAYCAMPTTVPGVAIGEQPPRIGSTISNWPGRTLGVVVAVGGVHHWTRRGCYGKRWYIRVRDVHGAHWHGTGAPGMYASLRRCK